jgi:hypothetical protein
MQQLNDASPCLGAGRISDLVPPREICNARAPLRSQKLPPEDAERGDSG